MMEDERTNVEGTGDACGTFLSLHHLDRSIRVMRREKAEDREGCSFYIGVDVAIEFKSAGIL